MASPGVLEKPGRRAYTRRVWNQPYLETCCRAALHRLVLAAEAGRPGSLKDGPCLDRLTVMGLAAEAPGARYSLTEAGRARHSSEILRQPATASRDDF